MTKPQIWVAAFLFLFIVLFAIGRLTKEEKIEQGIPEHQTVPQTSMEAEASTPMDLITSLGCTSCHGTDLNGSGMGPALVNLSDDWSREELINYLRNPSDYSTKERIKKHKQKFGSILMPSYNYIDVKELGKISDYLLQR